MSCSGRSRISIALITILAIGLVFCASSAIADWITAAGGNAARSGFVDCIGPDQADRVWDGVRYTRYVRLIVVAEGRIYAQWNQANNPFNEVFVLDLETGEELWSVELPLDGCDPNSHRSRVSGVRDGQAYLTRSSSPTTPVPMYAHDAVDGSYVWTSEALIAEYSGQSCSFTPDGDLICQSGTTGNDGIVRINHEDGSTVWFTPNTPPSSDANGAVVWGDRVYAWDWENSDAVVSAYDIESGEYLYCSQGLQYWGPVIQQGLFVGLDGKVYAPRPSNSSYENYLYALEDTGEALELAWTYPLGPGPFATHGVGPDGTIFTQDITGHLVGLDPDIGTRVLVSDDPIPGYGGLGWTDFSPRLVVDAQGKVFVGNGSYAAGAIAAYDADLNLLWTEDVGTQSITGPALSATGELVVQTRFQGMIIYRSEPTAVAESPGAGLLTVHPNAPNPFSTSTVWSFTLGRAGPVRVGIYDLRGRHVRTLLQKSGSPGLHRVDWDGRDESGLMLSAGIYLARVENQGRVVTQKVHLVR